MATYLLRAHADWRVSVEIPHNWGHPDPVENRSKELEKRFPANSVSDAQSKAEVFLRQFRARLPKKKCLSSTETLVAKPQVKVLSLSRVVAEKK